jgi:hypothetical protein
MSGVVSLPPPPPDAIMAWNGPTAPLKLHLHSVHPPPYTMSITGCNMGKKWAGCKAITHLNLMLKWRIYGPIPPLSYTFFKAWSLVTQKVNLICTFTDFCQVKRIFSCLDICRYMRISKDNLNEHGMAKLVTCIQTCIPFPYLSNQQFATHVWSLKSK